MARRRRIRFIQYRIVSIELRDGFHPTRGVALAEHPREVCLHEAVIVDGFSGHVLPSGVKEFRKACVVALNMVSLASPVERLLSWRLGKTLFDSAVGSPNPLSRRDQFFRSCRHAAGVAPVSFRNVRPKCTASAKPVASATSSSEALVSISSACARRMRASSCQR